MSSTVQDELPPDPLEEALVAYLDGELQGEARASVERQIAENPQARQRLQQMQRAWDMLDMLGRVDSNEKFARTTVEMVAVAASQDVQTEQADWKKSVRWSRWLLGAGIALSLLLGYVATNYALTRHDRQLVQDLPVIEHLDEYQSIPSVQFLQRLEQDKLFSAESDHASR